MPFIIRSHLKELMLARELDPSASRPFRKKGRTRYSIFELGQETQVPRSTLDRVAAGKPNVTIEVLLKLMGHLGLHSIDELYEVVFVEDDSER